jgi:AMP deaminase
MGSDGIYQIYSSKQDQEQEMNALVQVPDVKKYFQDQDYILSIISFGTYLCPLIYLGPAKSFAYRRLRYLESKFQMYLMLNEYQEMADSKSVPHRDFYNVRKVDTHIHHSACMNQKHLLRYLPTSL